MGKTKRMELSAKLHEILGSSNVYFQPGPDLVMNYPCLTYERAPVAMQRANNKPYAWSQGYLVTYMDHSPDSDVIDKLIEFPFSEFNRHFATSGLNHDVFVIYH